MPRSKSPARAKKAAAAASPLDDPNIKLAVTVAVCVGYLVAVKNTALNAGLVGAFFGIGSQEHYVAHWPYSLILTGHVFNKCQNSGGGYWFGSVINAALACFSGYILLDIINGDASRLLKDEHHLSLVVTAWYLCNHNLPFTKINVWSLVKDSPVGGLLQHWLDGCSKVFTANLILAAAATSSTAGPLGHSVITPIALGALVGSASEFVPLSKGLNIKSRSAQMAHAMSISTYTALSPIVFGLLPALASVHDPVAQFLGGNLVIAFVMIDHLAGQHIPFSPVADATKFLEGALNL